MQRCISCNRELRNGVTEAYDARKPTCDAWGQKCEQGGAASLPHDAQTEEVRRLEAVYAQAQASRGRDDLADDLGAERLAHQAVLEATAESVVAGKGALSEEQERKVAEKARRAAKR